MTRRQRPNIRRRIFHFLGDFRRRPCNSLATRCLQECFELLLVRGRFEAAEEMGHVRVEDGVGGVGGREGVEVDFGLGAGFDYYGAGGVGGYALTTREIVVSLRTRSIGCLREKRTYWPAAL